MTDMEDHTNESRTETDGRSIGRWTVIAAAVTAFLSMGVSSPDCGQIAGPDFVFMTQLDLHVSTPGSGEANEVKSDIVESINNADRRILASLGEDVTTQAMVQALVRAKNERNLDVQIIADTEDRSTMPFQQLEGSGFTSNAAGNCEVPNCDITYGDGQLKYLPNPNLTPVLSGCERQGPAQRVLCTANSSNNLCGGRSGDGGSMCRPDDFNRLSHRFFVIDTETVWNISGDGGGAGMLAWRVESEWMMESFEREFRQLRGGTFSTTLDEYNGPLKSVTDPQVNFNTDQGVMELRYNPQERLMKHVVDEIYAARSSVTVVTPKLTNPFVVDALEYKADNGFRVRVVISDQAQPQRSLNSNLASLPTRTVGGGRSLPTLVATDVVADQDYPNFAGNPTQWPRHMMVLSHPLIRARPFAVLPPANPSSGDASDRVRVYPADLFNDGNMWHLYEFNSNAHDWAALDQFEGFAASLWNSGSTYQP
jgi:hypothetical protein